MKDADAQGTPMGAHALEAVEARVAAGDRTAFAELYDVLAPRVFDDLAAAVGPARAGTLTTALLVDAWEQAARIRSEAMSITAWVLEQTRRLAVATGPIDLRGE